jgi:diaminobutyrate-2-oxoglutarate transaminase
VIQDAKELELEAQFSRIGRTAVPGPQCARLLARQEELESSAVSYPRRLPIAIRRAAGPYVQDADGNVYIDCLTGAGVLVLGHNHPEVLEAANRQMGIFCQGLDFPTETKDAFTQAQLGQLPSGLAHRMRLHFCGPTGGDAVDAAVKLAKLHTGADEVISFTGSYHGCGHGGLSFSSVRAMKKAIGNRVPGVHFFPFSDCAACPLGMRRDRCDVNCATYLEHALRDSHSGLGRPAAVIMELVQGEGGVVVAEPDFVRRVRQVTRDLGIVLIVDEIQTGCGRTGTWFAFERYGIEPDIILLSKGVSGMGAPISLMFYRREIDAWGPGMHIGTFRGNQMAFAAGLKTIEIFKRDRVLENVAARGDQAWRELEALRKRYAIVGGVRGIGLMLGIEMVDPQTGQPSASIARQVQREALERGLIVEVGGREDTIVRMLPPLNIAKSAMSIALEILSDSVTVVHQAWERHEGPRSQSASAS